MLAVRPSSSSTTQAAAAQQTPIKLALFFLSFLALFPLPEENFF